jgi:hypothetical protein
MSALLDSDEAHANTTRAGDEGHHVPGQQPLADRFGEAQIVRLT